MANVQKIYMVTFDCSEGNIFTVHLLNGKIIFKQCGNGLYYYDMERNELLFVMTVKENENQYTRRQIEGTEAAKNCNTC